MQGWPPKQMERTLKRRHWTRNGLAILGSLVAVLVFAAPALAAPCSVDLVDSGDFEWDLSSDGAISDGEHLPTSRSDAYDTFGELYVSTDAGTSYSEYTNPDATACTYEDGDREVAFPADTTTVADLEIRRKVFVPASGLPFARWIDSLTNTGGTPITLRLRWGGDLGSDSYTTVISTSSGDEVVDAADRWASTGGDDDPQLAHNWDTTFSGADDVADVVGWFQPDDPTSTPSNDDFTVEYRDVVVPAGATLAYMHAEAMRLNETQATTAAVHLGGHPDELNAGLSATEAEQIRNWNVGDRDNDGTADSADNCPSISNPDQANLDGDGHGDACDEDIDGDGRSNTVEAVIGTDPRKADTDGDGVRDDADLCPLTAAATANGCHGPPPAVDVERPKAKLLGLNKKQRRIARAKLLKRGLVFRLRCNEPCSVQAELVGRARVVRLARAGDVVLGTRTIRRARPAHRVKVKVQRKLRRAVRKGNRLTLRVTVTDRSGNSRTVGRKLRVR